MCIRDRFGTAFAAKNITMTVGAAGGLNVILKALLNPGDEVITFAPYFGEYRSYVKMCIRDRSDCENCTSSGDCWYFL